jgi:uncharacterized protein (TIGR04255 family)
MSLPKRISPSPLFNTTIEVRFQTKLDRIKMLQKMLTLFLDMFTDIKEGNIPNDIKKSEPQFKYAADYIMKNDDYMLSFGENSIAFEHISEYKLWPTYFSFIKECILRVFKSDIIDTVERCGVRYGSLMEGKYEPKEILIELPKIDVNGMTRKLAGYQAFYYKNNNTLFLQIKPNTKLKKENENGEKNGLYIDIDASRTKELFVNESLLDVINQLHQDQKELFFGILNKEYLETLNPEY